MKTTIYLLCGLGADERLFQFLDLTPYEAIAIHWVKPEVSEDIAHYARRLLPQISSPMPVLMGVSFGGMVAIEIGKLIPTQKIILISSSPSELYIPRLYKFIALTGLHHLVSGKLLKHSHRLMNWFLGATGDVYRKLLDKMLNDSDEDFLAWAIASVVTWENKVIPANVIRIHGSKDNVLPYRGTDFLIKGGGHLIVADRATEVNAIIKNMLA